MTAFADLHRPGVHRGDQAGRPGPRQRAHGHPLAAKPARPAGHAAAAFRVRRSRRRRRVRPRAGRAGRHRTVVTAIDGPLNVLALAGGQTVAELGALGVARISTGSLLFRAAVGATVATAHAVARGEAGPTGLPQYTDIIRLVGERRFLGG